MSKEHNPCAARKLLKPVGGSRSRMAWPKVACPYKRGGNGFDLKARRRFIETLWEVTKGDAYVTSDVASTRCLPAQ